VTGEGRVEKGPPIPFSVRSGFLRGSFVVGWGLGPSKAADRGHRAFTLASGGLAVFVVKVFTSGPRSRPAN
jgi:hypothetical protein